MANFSQWRVGSMLMTCLAWGRITMKNYKSTFKDFEKRHLNIEILYLKKKNDSSLHKLNVEWEYRIYIENHDIREFAKLTYKARNTGALVARLRKNARVEVFHNRGWRPPPKRAYEVAFTQAHQGKWPPLEDP